MPCALMDFLHMSKNVLRDVILIVSILAVSALLFIVFFSSRSAGKSFEITVNGKLYGTYQLDKDTVIDVDGHCTVQVKDGAVSVTSSDCPGKDCVHHKPISRSGERIICLPNGIVIRITGDEVDAAI